MAPKAMNKNNARAQLVGPACDLDEPGHRPPPSGPQVSSFSAWGTVQGRNNSELRAGAQAGEKAPSYPAVMVTRRLRGVKAEAAAQERGERVDARALLNPAERFLDFLAQFVR